MSPPGSNIAVSPNSRRRAIKPGGHAYSYWADGGVKQTDTLLSNYNELGKLTLAYVTPPVHVDPNNFEFMGLDALDHLDFHGHQTTAGETFPFTYLSTDGLRPETIYEWRCTQMLNVTPTCPAGSNRLYVLGPDPDERWAFFSASGGVYEPHTDREGTLIAQSNGGVGISVTCGVLVGGDSTRKCRTLRLDVRRP